jgi:glycogen synthase
MIAGVAGRAEGGVAGVVHNLTKELFRLGHVVKPMFFEDILPKTRWPSRFGTVEFAAKVAEYARQVKDDYDIINIHAPFGFWYGFQRRLFGSRSWPPYVMTMHGLEERRNYAMLREAQRGRADFFRLRNRMWQHFYHMRTFRWSFYTADQSIVLNREALVFLQLLYGLPPDRVSFIPNGVESQFFRLRLPPKSPDIRLLFVGTWIDHKGIYYLREAFEKIVALFPGTRLTIAGCVEPEESVKRHFSLASQRYLSIRSFVSRSEMPDLYAEHDVFVLPSLMEGMPLVLIEAMASSMAIVTTESSGMTDLVEHGYNGLLTIPGNTSSLVDAIARLCRDSQFRIQLGFFANEKAKRFTWSHSAVLHEAVFRRAVSASSNEKTLVS